jgi:uncharacterized Zn ribbon protein
VIKVGAKVRNIRKKKATDGNDISENIDAFRSMRMNIRLKQVL